ncbi:MAG: deoxyribose-phosphate aldolase [Desulfobulbaceae bacterium]|nr:MAG: deoxyribose-phosphate aldolase [Desulfobulbaceae bacterium]
MEAEKLAAYFDHTILKPDATASEVEKLCREAIGYRFFSVCVNPVRVSLARLILTGSNVKVCTVIGFPLGAQTSEIKAAEARQAIENGAEELDMVINIGELKQGDHENVTQDIAAVVSAARGVVVKVIIETCLLSQSEIVDACKCARAAGADFVKTSTGFSSGGATVEDIALMKESAGEGMQVKASGGIKTLADACEMIDAGATRLGASASVAIITELLSSEG